MGAGGIKSLVVIDRNVFPVLKLPIYVFISAIDSLYFVKNMTIPTHFIILIRLVSSQIGTKAIDVSQRSFCGVY